MKRIIAMILLCVIALTSCNTSIPDIEETVLEMNGLSCQAHEI